MQVRQHRRDLDLGVLEQLFDPLLLAGAVLHQGAAVAGEIAQPTDLGRLHQRGPAHATLGDLRQPDRVGPIRLRPARHILDLAGVDQPAVKPLGLQQVVHPLPVGAGGLHHHPLHVPVPQPGRHRQQLCGGRGVAAQLLHPPAGPLRVRHPHTRLQTGLAQIQRRHPLHHQIGIVDFIHRENPSNAADYNKAVARRNRTGMEKSRTLVLIATMRSPTIGSPDQTQKRAHCAKNDRPRRATAPDFPACAGVPEGDQRTDMRGLATVGRDFRREWIACLGARRVPGCVTGVARRVGAPAPLRPSCGSRWSCAARVGRCTPPPQPRAWPLRRCRQVPP